ncbi:Poly-beta-hydroxybutyrate polymerase [compost metagenome]
MSSLRERKSSEGSLVERLRTEVSQLVQRSVKGFEYLTTPHPQVGVTPRTLLHRRGTLALYHYHSTASEVYRVPLLMVMALNAKASIFDLTKGQSLIEYLIGRGYDVYVIDWNAPTAAESHLKVENYVLDFIPDSVRRVQEDSGCDEVSMIGYCMGGVLSTTYAALHPEGPLKNLVLFTTPTDFSKMFFHSMLNNGSFNLDRMIGKDGLLSAASIEKAIDLHRPATRYASQLRLWDNMWNDHYVKAHRMMASWGSGAMPFAGAFFRQMHKEYIQKNGFVEGGIKIGGKPVELKNIKVPLLHVIAQYDSLVPPECAKPLVEGVSSTDKEEVILPGGHVSLVAGPAAVKRMWPKLDQWLSVRSV